MTKRSTRSNTLNEIASVIDRTQPRPTLTDAKYATWRKASKQARTWILSHLGNDIMEELRTSGMNPNYADDLVEALRSVVKGYGRRLGGVVFIKATNIRRDRFATVDQNIKEFKSLGKESNRPGCPITPYCAAIILFSWLSSSSLTMAYCRLSAALSLCAACGIVHCTYRTRIL
jgi:hypothetical protein